jgi:manganese efflux pump family protein
MAWSVLWLAVGLAMDAAAVCATRGLAAPKLGLREVVKVAVLFGGAQALMPWIGALAGARLGPMFAEWDHWVAFGLLGGIGVHMLIEAAKADDSTDELASTPDLFGLRALALLAIATSIDALAAGITLPMLGAPLAVSIATIGVVTAVLCASALLAGRHIGRTLGARFQSFGRTLDAIGGITLIALGAKILTEHLSAS